MKLLLTIAVTSYNKKGKLELCLNSIIPQINDGIELLIIDDGSTDGSIEYIQGAIQNISNSRLIALENNLGPSHARNIGIVNAQGKYIVFIDGDDQIVEGCIRELQARLESFSKELDVASLNFQVIPPLFSEQESHRFQFKPNIPVNTLLNEPIVSAIKEYSLFYRNIWGWVFNVSFLRSKKCWFVESARASEDLEFMTRCLCIAKDSAILDISFYKYYRYFGSLSKSAHPSSLEGIIPCLLSLAGFLNRSRTGCCEYDYVLSGIEKIVSNMPSKLFVSSSSFLLELSTKQKAELTHLKEQALLAGLNQFIPFFDFLHHNDVESFLLDVRSSMLAQTLKDLDKSRDLRIFGAGSLGQSLAVCLSEEGFNIKGLIDSNPLMQTKANRWGDRIDWLQDIIFDLLAEESDIILAVDGSVAQVTEQLTTEGFAVSRIKTFEYLPTVSCNHRL